MNHVNQAERLCIDPHLDPGMCVTPTRLEDAGAESNSIKPDQASNLHLHRNPTPRVSLVTPSHSTLTQHLLIEILSYAEHVVSHGG